MNSFVYPVDTDQFQLIREQGKLYVDKTDLIFDIVNVKKYQYVFLARPRRFGKSLLCNTFKAYFQGQRELFEGLKIIEFEKEWKKYPVLHFTLSGLKNVSVPEAKTKLESLIRGYEAIYGRDPLSLSPGDRFKDLIHNAFKQSGEKVVVILDEYDTAIMRLIYDKDQLHDMHSILREFYQVLKDEGAYLKFVFITGVTKFSELSIFSEINNLKQITMFDDYSGLCGITQKELDTVLRPCVKEFADELSITIDRAYALLKKSYDGYRFSANGEEVYAPFSLLNALNDRQANYYWFESGTSAALIEHLKHFQISDALEYDGIQVGEDEFNIPCENAETPMPLLYQSGYLTIDKYESRLRTYTLHFPNLEVREGIIRGLMPLIIKRQPSDNNNLIRSMASAIFDGKLSDALAALRSYIAKIPYDIITRQEWDNKEARESFYKLLLYMSFSMLNSVVDTEVKSILGRADVVIKTQDNIFVLELKVDDTVDNALSQIDSVGYTIPFEADDKHVIKCGVSIMSEQRNISHWRIVDSAGYILDERKF